MTLHGEDAIVFSQKWRNCP